MKLKYDETLSNSALNFNLRQYAAALKQLTRYLEAAHLALVRAKAKVAPVFRI